MAEIEIKRKTPGPWTWILGVLAVALGIWLVAELWDDEPELAELEPVEEVVVPAPAPDAAAIPGPDTLDPAGAVEAYAARCGRDASEMVEPGLQHQFTVGCLRQFANAVNSAVMAQDFEDVAVDQRLQEVRDAARALETSDPMSQQHANTTREAFGSMADLISAVAQVSAAPAELGTAAENMRATAERIEPDRPLLEQKDALTSFFAEAERALRSLSAMER